MTMNKSTKILAALLGVGLLVAGGISIAACKQGDGERCQVQSDCDNGLVCTGEGLCKTVNAGQIDAPPVPPPPIDAPLGDALPPG